MAKYRKKALMVTAVRADRHQFITTLEGVTEAEVGDYIVTGVDYEQWALKPEWFNVAYTHIGGDTYQRKPQVLEAVQIEESEVISSPNGDMRGDKGDYKITGTKGEQWYCKPDIFDKTYEIVKKGMNNINTKTRIQKAINQIGKDAVLKSLSSGMVLAYCDVHGHYVVAEGTSAVCELCPSIQANGEAATDTELYINLDPTRSLTNPQQKLPNPAI